jgi:hypothetical protein
MRLRSVVVDAWCYRFCSLFFALLHAVAIDVSAITVADPAVPASATVNAVAVIDAAVASRFIPVDTFIHSRYLLQ